MNLYYLQFSGSLRYKHLSALLLRLVFFGKIYGKQNNQSLQAD